MGENGWRQSAAGKVLEEQLAAQETLLALTLILQRAESVDRALQAAETVSEEGKGLLAIATDSADEAVRSANQAGIDVEEG
jgi:hypothetical protein